VLGAGAMSLGVIEGAAEAANSGLRILSGWLADRWRSPKKLVLAGYGLASAVRPLISLATSWPQVFAIRFVDRLGKGIRGAPRDAMLADLAPEDARGRVFGFHRAMDHAGAVSGPLLASAFLYFFPGQYRTLFALTIIPGVIVMLILLRVPDRTRRGPSVVSGFSRTGGGGGASVVSGFSRTGSGGGGAVPLEPVSKSSVGSGFSRTASNPPLAELDSAARTDRAEPRRSEWHLGSTFYKAMGVILLFSLGNASDAFLLLRLSNLGVATFWIPLLWSALHVVKVASSLAGGALSDRFGRRALIAIGWVVYALVYAGFGFSDSRPIVIAIFVSYGLYFGLTEGNEKAWVADMAPEHGRGTAFGIYNAALGVGSLLASLLFGLLWTRVSPQAAFLTGAALAMAAAGLLYLVVRPFDGAQGRPFDAAQGRSEPRPAD
jgi:MFS family permease